MSLYGYPQIQINFGGLSWAGAMASGVSTISAIDASFNGDEFLSFAQGAFLRVQEAKANGRIDDVRPLVSETVWPSFKAAQTQKGPKVVSIEHATIYDAHRDAHVDSVTVRFAAKTEARKKNDLIEDWTFHRPAVTSAQQLPPECPSCGAPLSLDENGSCKYCRVTVGGARGGWKLVRAVPAITPTRTRSSGATWLWSFIIFMVLMTVVLPIGIMIAVGKTTSDAFNGFGSSSNGSPGTSVQSKTKENVNPSQKSVPKSSSTIKAVPGTVSGTADLTGAITGSTSGTTSTVGGTSGPCATRAANVSGLTFAETQTDPNTAGQQTITVTMNLPAGSKGPGTYDLATSAIDLSAAYASSPPAGSASPPEAQTWKLGPTSSVTFTLDENDSGTLEFSGLTPTAPFDQGNSLSQPLSGTIEFTCD